nr:NAD(P)/FAD-dependent oxidoreductase [Allorhizobium ampelinum]
MHSPSRDVGHASLSAVDVSPKLESGVLVIGGGQAGLAAAHALTAAGIDFLVVDANSSAGESWRRRYDALSLFTPRAMSGLPGLPLDGDPEGYATKDEFADYLSRYRAVEGFPSDFDTKIVSLRKSGDVFEAIASDGRRFVARAVIVATGAFQNPRRPEIAGKFGDGVRQIDISEFRNGSSVKQGPVLVVGDGASGRDVAVALSTTHEVVLAKGRPRKLLPEKVLGMSTWWWLKTLGLLRAGPNSAIGRRMRAADPFPRRGNDDGSLGLKGVVLRPRLTSVQDGKAVFKDRSSMVPKTVIWATGYFDDFRWIEIEGATGSDGQALHASGVSPVPGLYFVGRPWQRNRASGLIMGTCKDAAFVVQQLASDLGR